MTTITVETTMVTETTTDGDQMTPVIAIAMIGKTTIMIGMMMIGMTDTIRGIPVMISANLTEDRATTEGITTTVVGTPPQNEPRSSIAPQTNPLTHEPGNQSP